MGWMQLPISPPACLFSSPYQQAQEGIDFFVTVDAGREKREFFSLKEGTAVYSRDRGEGGKS